MVWALKLKKFENSQTNTMQDPQESPFDNVEFPPLSSLPFRKGDPDGAIWGFYEHVSNAPSTHKDELGSLNLLTPSRILNAAKTEIQCGRVCSLNWALQKPSPAPWDRRQFQHRVFRWPDRFVLDDEVEMNTQGGSQWDGLGHFGIQKTGQFYNGALLNEIVGHDLKGTMIQSGTKKLRNGIQAFQGKIVGRGVLLDYASFAEANNISYSPNERHFVTASALDACAQAQGVSLCVGDILFIRVGFIQWYEKATPEEREEKALKLGSCLTGMGQGSEEVEWLWKHHFAAVASDNPGFEAVPPGEAQVSLHEYLLPLWGTPIGELFDLEDLAKTCRELNRYSFFVTSSPLNIVNGIASPPNALALF